MARKKQDNIEALQQRLARATTAEEIAAIEQEAGIAKPQLVVRTLAEVSAIVNVTLGTIKNWRLLDPPMPGEEGRWDVVAILLWQCDRLRRASTVNQVSPAKAAADLRCAEADATMREIKAQRAAGNLVDRTAAMASVAGILNEARVMIEAIPSIVGATMPPELRSEIIHEMRQQITLVLRNMAKKATEQET